MAPVPNLAVRQDSGDIASSTKPYPAAILLATFSLLVALLITPPMCWHYRNRNIGAMFLVLWIVIMNLQSFVNALIWPNDNIPTWYNGAGLCDVEVKLIEAWGIAGPASLACVLRGLANAMNPSRATLVKSEAARQKDLIIDLTACVGLPAITMLFHYIVQDSRYSVFGITGCVAMTSKTWVTLLLIELPRLLFTILDTVYAILILARLCRYRVTFGSILASSNMTKNRFLRLYIFCIILAISFIPLQAYLLTSNGAFAMQPFNWYVIHNPETWNQIVMIPSNGRILAQSWIWLGGGYFIFVFFGLGRDAVKMYRSGLLAMGFDLVFPGLRQDRSRRETTGTISSIGSKAKLLFKRKDSMASWRTSATGTERASSLAEPTSPKNMTFAEAIKESDSSRSWSAGAPEKAPLHTEQSSLMSRIAAVFTPLKARSRRQVSYPDVGDHHGAVRAAIISNPRQHGTTASMEVMVQREVRQDSETAERPTA